MAADAQSQDTPARAAGKLEEVTVTAERFGATVQTTPVAVTAISPEALAERQISNVMYAATEIPGIVITPSTGSSSSARIVLRGAGQEQGGINFDPAVGIYIDNVYQPRINGAFFDFFDVERLEVLRGPQGTLYGRNTSGGALKIESKRPSFYWTGAGELAGGNFDTREAKVYLSGPIVENKLAFSVSGVTRQRDGFIYGRAYGERIGDMERYAERAKLLFTPTDKLDIEFAAYAMQDYSDPGVGVPLQVSVGVVDPYAVPGRDLTATEMFGPLNSKINNGGASINATYSISEALQLNSISGYGNLRTYAEGNALWLTAAAQAANDGRLNIGGAGEGISSDEFLSQEFNATYTSDRLKGVAGVFYFDESGSSRSLSNNSPTIDQDRDTKAYAVFAQGTYTLGHGVGLTAGARWTREVADFTQFYRTQLTAPQSDSKTFTATTPKFGVNWQITPNLLTYASLTKGFKSGGFNPVPPNANTGVPGQTGRPTPYGPEKVDSYEVGVKFTTDDGMFRLNAAAYRAEYDGLQLPVFFPGTSTSYTSNATGATIQGIELEPTWQVFDSLQLYGNMSFTHGEYTDSFICSGADGTFRDCSGNKIKGLVPEKVVAGFRYAPQLPMPGQLSIVGSWTYSDKYYNNVANEIDLVQTQAVDLYNGSISWTDAEGRWNVSLEGRNLSDKHYVLAGLQLASPVRPAVTGYINEPRQVVLRVGANF